jgi:hypothetical protein
MSRRRFRPTLDSLPSRIAPSGFASAPAMAPPEEPGSTETTEQVSYPTITCCERRDVVDFYA